MATPVSNLRGIALMVLATCAFVVNDSFLKLVTDGLPPFQSLFLRGVSAAIWCVPLLLVTGNLRRLPQVGNRWVLARNSMELFAVLCFIVALANMPIADITALTQVAPMLLLIGVSIVYGERIGALRMVLIGLGFVGAVLVAQPGGAGVSPYAVLGFGTALGTALREIIARKVPAAIPGPVVATSAVLVVMVGALAAHLLFEQWVMPDGRHLLLLLASGFFLTIGHLTIFLAYRNGTTAAVAPFFYMFTVWAVISGLVVFGTFPNALAIAGILLILGSGVVIVTLDERRRRLTVVA
ncbi:MAG TPA: DMT family transporter [Devosiaceae bacterium]|jgi:drug/metabolite transporter (DMT)-like permease|nr:DMT family transporter [Devosiaceae bacterium]